MSRLRHFVIVLALATVSLPAVASDSARADSAPLIPPVSPKLAEAFLQELMHQWSRHGLAELLADDFEGRAQLLQMLPHQLPAGARIEILDVGGIQTVAQQRVDNAVVSIVSATVHAQLLYEHPVHGLQREPGSAEYVFRIVRRAPR